MSDCNSHHPDDRLSRRDLLLRAGGIGLAVGGGTLLGGEVLNALFSRPVQRAASAAQYLAIVVIDAARADYLNYGHLPTLKALAARGTSFRNAWVGQMESITPASHATIGTGVFPRHDGGILGFWYENAQSHANYTCAPLNGSDPARIERIIKAAGVPTLSGLIKQQDPGARIYTTSGQKFYAADAVGGPDADYIGYFTVAQNNGWVPVSIPGHELPANIIANPGFRFPNYKTMALGQQDYLAARVTSAVIKQERPRFVMVNLAEMDWPVAHINGGPVDPAAVTTLMENADRAVALLIETYRELGVLDQTVTVVTGDHGVIPMTNQVDRTPILNAIQQAGTGYVTSDFHTGGFLWLQDPSKAAQVAVNIDQAAVPGVSGVYYRTSNPNGSTSFMPSPATIKAVTTPVDTAYRYLLGTLNGADAPHVVIVYKEHTGTLDAGGDVTWKGDHGGFSWESHAVPLIMAGPGIRSGYVSSFPARTVDLTPTMLRLLGVPYPQFDGVALADAFRRRRPPELDAQNAVTRYLTPIAD